jgi:CheY-like chemotaxis protein
VFGDDDAEQRDLFRILLEGAGHEVVSAATAAEVLGQLERGAVDLLIVDLRFPRCEDGLALIRSVRELGCRGPILLLSGWPDEIHGRPEEEMVTRILVKPVPVPELLREIAELAR